MLLTTEKLFIAVENLPANITLIEDATSAK